MWVPELEFFKCSHKFGMCLAAICNSSLQVGSVRHYPLLKWSTWPICLMANRHIVWATLSYSSTATLSAHSVVAWSIYSHSVLTKPCTDPLDIRLDVCAPKPNPDTGYLCLNSWLRVTQISNISPFYSTQTNTALSWINNTNP